MIRYESVYVYFIATKNVGDYSYVSSPNIYYRADLYAKASSPYVLLAFRVIRQNELVDYVHVRQRGLSLMAKSSSLYSCYVVIYTLYNYKKGGRYHNASCYIVGRTC